ncbi:MULTISPECIES: hypothetical protein [unclassified Stenotrophomonas]|uniref:hypothetical protein n=1 Tax=unclassified Stenotrophomonas TaxID=196198 RepID=UPI0025EE37AC|nr:MULTISPECIES: hypothetical protein [unclassified Stenotrophomonas]
MRQTSTVRVFSLLVLGVVTAVATSGCFFKRGARGDYALAPEARPLEVPPDLNLPNTSGATAIPALASATKPAAVAAPAAAANGFTVSGSRDEVFGKVGDALAGVEGLTIASRAQLLGSYDVAYEGSNFLVRVVATDAGAYVSAVDPRGLPATDAAATKLVAALKTRLGG